MIQFENTIGKEITNIQRLDFSVDPAAANLQLPTKLQEISFTVNGQTQTLTGGVTIINF